MAAKPTYSDWPDGKKHSIPYATHLANMRAKAGTPLTLPAPPVGTYDPAIDYNAKASQRGFDQLGNDAQTRFEQGGQDYGLNLGDLTRGRDWTQADILRDAGRSREDFDAQAGNIRRQFGILGRQQAEGAAQRGVTSQGLLGKSTAVRNENQGRDLETLGVADRRAQQDYGQAYSRTGTQYDQGKTRLDLGHAREFGGFNGQTILNPLTGQPEFGSLLTGVTRAGAENTAFQSSSGQQRAGQAAAGGYVSPLLSPIGGIAIGGTPLTGQMYQGGMLIEAMVRGSAKQQGKSVEEVARAVGVDPRTWQKIG